MDSPAVDLLSSLPEHLQDDILTRLDLRDAVRTSALSRYWCRRWETLLGLALSFPDGTPPSAVDRVLLRYAGPSASRFVSYVDGNEDDKDASASHVYDWIMALSRRSVESISIFNKRAGYFTVYSIFSCDRLVSLTLEGCGIPPLPQPQSGGGFAGFPVLKELYLTYVEFELADNGESSLRTIIRASPMLRVPVLDEVEAPVVDCVIEAPNLHTLALISSTIHWRFGELPCIQNACIVLPYCVQEVEFLVDISKVQELIFYLPRCDDIMDASPFNFSNLKSMELSADFAHSERILLIFCLLRGSPNLEKLKIQARWSIMATDQVSLNAQWNNGMCANLQVLEMISYDMWLPLSFIKLILSKASLLRTLSIDKCPNSQDNRLHDELLNCRKVSPQAQVLFKVELDKISFDCMKFAEKGSTKEQA